MADINTCIFSGRLTKKPELLTGKSGNEYANITIANDRGFGDKKATSFIDLTIFGKSAAALCQYCDKGDQIIVTCEYTKEKYDKDGETRYSHKHIVREWTFGAKSKNGGDSSPAPSSPVEGFSGLNDEDVPF